MTTQTVLTVFFDGSFWRALVERRSDGFLSIASHLFGEEPSEAETFQWWLTSSAFLEFSLPIPASGRSSDRSSNRKKNVQRAAKALRREPISDEIHAAARAERSRRRVAAHVARKSQRLALQDAKREKRIQRAREKKRGH
jgi:hypothetical protein